MPRTGGFLINFLKRNPIARKTTDNMVRPIQLPYGVLAKKEPMSLRKTAKETVVIINSSVFSFDITNIMISPRNNVIKNQLAPQFVHIRNGFAFLMIGMKISEMTCGVNFTFCCWSSLNINMQIDACASKKNHGIIND